jgi:hypothetical protein
VVRIRESNSEKLFGNSDFTSKILRNMAMKGTLHVFAMGSLMFDDFNYTLYNLNIFKEARNIKTELSGNFDGCLKIDNLKIFEDEDYSVVNFLMATKEEKFKMLE